MDTINVSSAPKSATFQMRINPEVKQRVEDIYARQGLTLTDAINIFIQQSLNMEGLPFLASPENEEYMKAKAVRRLMAEVQKGWDSAEKDGWVSEEEAYCLLGIEE
jgi:DNA-damage-inducible protein J